MITSNDIESIASQLEYALQLAEYPLRNDLEVGFRHSPLTDKEKLQRYELACKWITEDLKIALNLINELTLS